jgi:hypothetical protein
MVIITAIALYVGDKILEHIIQEEIWVKRIWHFLFPPTTFKNQLVKVINEVIEEYGKSHPYDASNGMFPFYLSKEIFDQLSLYVFFKKGSLSDIRKELTNFPTMIPPSKSELQEFYDLFYRKVESNIELKSLFKSENYKYQIYEIAEVIEEIRLQVASIKEDTSATRVILEGIVAEKESMKLTPQKAFEALCAQVNRQLKKQINSGKYLQDTFVETGNQKDNLRYLCDPVFYSQKCFEEINILDFRYLNNFLKTKNHPKFDLDFEKFNPVNNIINISNCSQIFNDWFKHIESKQKEIINLPFTSSVKSTFEYKFNSKIKDLSFLNARVALILETAGQGKTNFLCDFTENFLVKRNIPTVFLTGAEINASDIRISLLKRIFPDSVGYTFEELLNNLRKLCYEQNKFFVIIIDGLNENVNSKSFSQNLESLIAELLDYDFIRIVLSCRTEYYHHNYSNLEKSSFSTEIQKIISLLSKNPDDDQKDKLFDIYFHHFKISYKSISKEAHAQLVGNFLLLRIFCEAYQNQTLDFIEDIYKEELFEKYYLLKSEEINKRLSENDEFRVRGSFDIKNFISSVVGFMINTKTYVNVPFDKIITDPKDRELYVRFLDENILVKRDLQVDENGIFTSLEVVNFTFDEFRDFIISRYLVEILYKSSPAEFEYFIETQITDKSPLLEGCSTFLYYISRSFSDERLNIIIEKQPWFSSVFSRCIFSINDSKVTEKDKKMLNENLLKGLEINYSIILNLIHRYDTKHYKKLNIDFLFALLRELDDQQFDNCFSNQFGNDRRGFKINQKSLITWLSNLYEKKEIPENSSLHKLFELLIYMFTNEKKWEIIPLYEKYYFKYSEIGRRQLVDALRSKNKKLIKEVNKFISNYEISL